MSLHVLVLAGGTGTRLWPMSRRSTPKHLLPLGQKGVPLLRATVERVVGLGDSVHVVTAADQAALCVAALEGIPNVGFISEPHARGTGPALALATRHIALQDPDAIIVSVHADAYVGDVSAYRIAVTSAAGWATATGGLATVGVAPTYPAAFGYVELGEPKSSEQWVAPQGSNSEIAAVARDCPAYISLGFVEKPPLEKAREFVADGRHLWNSGLFAWPASTFESEVAKADATLAATINDVVRSRTSGDERGAERAYASLETVAVDPLVFERTPQLTVVKASFPWSDVGSWKDLHDVRVASGDGDADGNVVDGDVVLVNARNCMISSRGGRTVAVASVDGIVVVDTGDAVLVVPTEHAQQVKEIAELMARSERPATNERSA